VGIVLAAYAIGLALWAWRTDDPQMRPWLIAFAVLNLAGLAVMAAEDSPFLFRLMDADDEPPEPAWRR
jgi:hypothetical protein